MKNLITALVKARGEFDVIRKDKVNPYYKSKYADLDSVIGATEPALRNNGLAVTQTTKVVEGQGILVTTIWHESGESFSGEYPLPRLDDPQKLGAAITYARRYALCALLNVTADEDDDANAAKPTERDNLMQEIAALANKLKWNGQQTSDFIGSIFQGKVKRDQLSDAELKKLVLEMQAKLPQPQKAQR